MIELCIGNKNYSSWSMRPWVLLHDGLAVWDTLAIAEYLAAQDFRDFEEPYRLQR